MAWPRSADVGLAGALTKPWRPLAMLRRLLALITALVLIRRTAAAGSVGLVTKTFAQRSARRAAPRCQVSRTRSTKRRKTSVNFMRFSHLRRMDHFLQATWPRE